MFLGPNFFTDPNLGADFGLKAEDLEEQEDFLTISHKTTENRSGRYQENSVTEGRAFWNPRRFAAKISPSSHLIASNADDTKFRSIITNLLVKSARAIILFTRADDARSVKYLNENITVGDFYNRMPPLSAFKEIT